MGIKTFVETFEDFANLKIGTWLEISNRLYQVTTGFSKYNYCIGLSEIIFINNIRYTIFLEDPNVTFFDIEGAEIL